MMMNALFKPLSGEACELLTALNICIDTTYPLPRKFIITLPRTIAELSRLLTSARPERNGGYLSDPAMLNAYMRYFLMWNVYRLCKLFSSSDIQDCIASALLHDTDDERAPSIIDLGAGPLTLALALWISFPQLRSQKITLFALDHNRAALEAGRKLFSAFAGEGAAWKIKTIHGDIYHTGIAHKLPPARLVCAVHLFNESFWKIPQTDAGQQAQFTAKQAAFIAQLVSAHGAALVVEPGIPRCAQFISALKEAFEAQHLQIEAPCPPSTPCALRGGKRGSKWCHFSFDIDDSPPALQKLSASAGLAKEKAVLSFLLAKKLATKQGVEKTDALTFRIISDCFPLTEAGNEYGRYACSKRGLALLSGVKQAIASCSSGTLLHIDNPVPQGRDTKSGALVFSV
ncbi:MAG: rRNA methyltransferase [Spirochaetaceae bacterium]|jgi:ribosomal protein RSM22 (predicted rRNA methylase)|nr:rRNA methyltransferase [Spirochaetaceae bacterium]